MSGKLDRRLHAFRDDLADETLIGKVSAAEFVQGEKQRINAPYVDVRPQPELGAGIDTQLLHGDIVRVFDIADGWAWVQAQRDSYVGYLPKKFLRKITKSTKPDSHRVAVERSFRYAAPDMKTPIVDCLSMGSVVAIVGEAETRGTKYAQTQDGKYLIAHHLSPIDEYTSDYVSVAEGLLHTPYLWGGTTAFGVDCSGLVQLSMLMTGKEVMRDTDMQETSIGTELGFSAMDGGLKRGDLIFWKGHVGIMRDAETLIHANGHTMNVATEKLEDAIERIGYLYGFPTTLRRP
ncbi:MAG: NlpC/P60 family protein [Pseudomonadota bacterium]